MAAASRVTADRIELHWESADPASLYVSDDPEAALEAARLLAHVDHSGVLAFPTPASPRPYFILLDERDHEITRFAERLISLQRGSNFRDLGGYPAANGKHVRWGLIYRAAAMPMLTESDYETLKGLRIASDVDFRSVEERSVAPDLIPARTGARYFARDYPAIELFQPPGATPPVHVSQSENLIRLYRTWPTLLSVQYGSVFKSLLRHSGAVTFHCSAGQDRTGVATALVLSALGVPRSVILRDYLLSTADRQPENEMPRIDPARFPGNRIAAYYAKAQAAPDGMKAKPLLDAAGTPYLAYSFKEIEGRWGSVENYLRDVLGVGASDIDMLQRDYLE
jgi:protein-tyrosine phosphatase